jgi:GrpB-like predicted nucleotidyltransferase (UPF0157 family)
VENSHQSGIIIVPYDERWESEFLLLKRVLTNALGKLILRIEHVGSTSIKGLGAKPILDIDVVINDDFIFSEVANKLNEIGYLHKGDLGIEGREPFGCKDANVPWGENIRQWMEHHLYVCTKDNQELHRHLKFRNYLRGHFEVAREYDQLKVHLAKNSKSRLEYTEAKSEFINKILELKQDIT